VIDGLYDASIAGVPVEIVVPRDVCVASRRTRLSENITVESILGRFLEHSRIFASWAVGRAHVHRSADIIIATSTVVIEALVEIRATAKVRDECAGCCRFATDPATAGWTLTPTAHGLVR